MEQELYIDKKSGILYRCWKVSSPQAVFLLIHGFGAHSARWQAFANFFLRHNISSYALELKGFGETKSLKGHIDSFNLYMEDIRSLYNVIAGENPGKGVFIVGESMGGLIAFLMAGSWSNLLNGLVCLSPLFGNKLKFVFLNYIKVFLSLLYNPKRLFNVPFDSRMCTRDIEYQKLMDQDKRECRMASSRLLFEILLAQKRANFLISKIKMPILFLLAGSDMMVSNKASRKIFVKLKTKDKAIIEYPGRHHALSIDLGKEKVFEDILSWVQERL